MSPAVAAEQLEYRWHACRRYGFAGHDAGTAMPAQCTTPISVKLEANGAHEHRRRLASITYSVVASAKAYCVDQALHMAALSDGVGLPSRRRRIWSSNPGVDGGRCRQRHRVDTGTPRRAFSRLIAATIWISRRRRRQLQKFDIDFDKRLAGTLSMSSGEGRRRPRASTLAHRRSARSRVLD